MSEVAREHSRTNGDSGLNEDYAIRNRLNITIATAGDFNTAKASCLRIMRERGWEGLHVVKVETVVTETEVYRPRLRRVS